MSSSDEDELESYNNLSNSLTYTKPSSRLTSSDVSSYSDQSSSCTLVSSAFSARGARVEQEVANSYSEDFTPCSSNVTSADTDNDDLISSEPRSHTTQSDKKSTTSATELPESSMTSPNSSIADTYGSDFDSPSKHTARSSTSQELSRTRTVSHSDGYSSDFDSTISSSQTIYSSDFEVTSRADTGPSDRYASYTMSSECSAAGSYDSDFESVAQDDSEDSGRLTEQKYESELKYVEAMMKALKSTDDSNRRAAHRAIDEAAVRMRQEAQQSLPVRTYIARSLSNIKHSREASTDPDSVEDSTADTMGSTRGAVLPADHQFVSRMERLRVENIIAALKQRDEELSKEIERHEKFVRKGMPPHNARRFALPIKLRLEKEVFLSRLDDYQARMNTVSMIGDIAKDLPKPTDKPEAIWDQLMNTAQRRTS